MFADIYTRLQWKIILLTLLVTFTPLFLLGIIMYKQFAGLYTEKVREQISVRALAQAEALDLFLKERTAILGVIAETHGFQAVVSDENLARKLDVMNRWAGAFVDLGVIDADGRQLAYVGPYDLRGRNYGEQPWFAEVMSKGLYISDVYPGFRKVPHFIIAVRRQENQRTWILRATIDSEIFGRIVQGAMIGKTGDAFLVSEEGLLQTRPRFGGGILDKTPVNVSSFGKQTTTFEEIGSGARNLLVAGTWLKTKPWLLAITVDIDNEMAGLFATRTIQITIIAAGVLAIVLTTVFTTRLMVRAAAPVRNARQGDERPAHAVRQARGAGEDGGRGGPRDQQPAGRDPPEDGLDPGPARRGGFQAERQLPGVPRLASPRSRSTSSARARWSTTCSATRGAWSPAWRTCASTRPSTRRSTSSRTSRARTASTSRPIWPTTCR